MIGHPSHLRRLVMTFAAVVGVVLSSCGSGATDDISEPTPPTTAPPAQAPTSVDEPTSTTAPAVTTTPTDTTPATTSTPVVDEAWAATFAEIALAPTEPGPRPLLSWAAVDGAALYQLTVLDADMVPYWSWSGTETEVPLGGMDNPDAIGAWVFDELTWVVVARGADGAPRAMSTREVLEPAPSD
jgi:hypothetical protein